MNIGETNRPYSWVPEVSEVSLLRLGNFVSRVIIAVSALVADAR